MTRDTLSIQWLVFYPGFTFRGDRQMTLRACHRLVFPLQMKRACLIVIESSDVPIARRMARFAIGDLFRRRELPPMNVLVTVSALRFCANHRK